MSYIGGERHTSPYRSRVTPLRKDYTPSVTGGSRYASPYTSERRDTYSPPRRHGGEQRYTSNNPVISSGASVSTNVLDGLIDNAMNRRPLPPPSNNYRSPSLASRMTPSYQRDSKINSRTDSRTRHQPSDNTSASRSIADGGYRSATPSRHSSNRYRPRDPSPRYRRDTESYVNVRNPLDGRKVSSVPRSDWRDDNGSRGPRDRERGFTSDRERGSVYDRDRDSNSRRDYNDRNRKDARGGEWNRSDGRDNAGRRDYDNVNLRGGNRGDSTYYDRQPTPSYGRNDDCREGDDFREGDRRQLENYHASTSPLDSRLPFHQQPFTNDSPSGISQVDVFQSDLSAVTGALFGTSPSVAAMPASSIPAYSVQSAGTGALYGASQSLAAVRTTPEFQTHSAQSIASRMSNASAWHGDDIILIPRGQKESGVAAAATAAASLIVDDVNSVCGFETAARSITNLIQPETEEKAAMAVLTPAIIGRSPEGQSHIPMSYSSIKEGVKRDLMVAASVNTTRENKIAPLPMNAYQFWSRCTLLVATAILKVGPQYTQIALAASEAVMVHGIASIHHDWLKTADQDLKQSSHAVSDVIINNPGGSETLASTATIVLLSEGNKTISMERIRSSIFAEVASQYSQDQHFQPGKPAVAEDQPPLSLFAGDESSSHYSRISRNKASQDRSQEFIGQTPRPPRSRAETHVSDMPLAFENKRHVSTRSPDESPHRVRNDSFYEKEELRDKAMVIPTLSLVPSEHGFADGIGEDNRKGAIRNVGSLLDADSNDDDDSKDDNDCADKSKTGRINKRSPAPHTTQQMTKSPSTIARREYMSATVNRIIGSPSKERKVKCKGKETPVEMRKQLKNTELERKRCEIAVRIKNIQMRAAAERDMPQTLEDNMKRESDHTRNKTKQLVDSGGHRRKNSKSSRQIQDSKRSADRALDAPIVSKASSSFVDNILQTFSCGAEDAFDKKISETKISQSQVKIEEVDDEWEAFRRSEVANEPIILPKGPTRTENWETLDSHDEQEQLVEDVVPQMSSSYFNKYMNGPAKPKQGTGTLKHTQSVDSHGAFTAVFDSGKPSDMSVKKLSLGR